tara:strand:- start:236 stop:955 length:720 start_codon:yes stop_codon:yes gene_type:complete
MDSKRVNRTDKFCNSVKKKDVSCVLSNTDAIQCECAHIVPLNGDYGQANYKNADVLNSEANGMLLSKELHFLYDQFIWCINPHKYEEIEGIPKKRKYKIEIVSSYKDKNLSINNYSDIILRSETFHFVELAYKIFVNNWNPTESNYKKLELTSNSSLHILNNLGNCNSKYNTIDKLDNDILDQLNEELNELIVQNMQNKKNFNKSKKIELSQKYNIHEQSIETHYKQLKKNTPTRPSTH